LFRTRHLGLGSYEEWDEAKRQDFLVKELQGKRPLIPREFPCSEVYILALQRFVQNSLKFSSIAQNFQRVREVLDTFEVISELGTESLGAYVISMCSTPSDILLVQLLQKEKGAKTPLRVVPLFETLDDLQRYAEFP
jgi:phosphoenolpyruvate carboxylase